MNSDELETIRKELVSFEGTIIRLVSIVSENEQLRDRCENLSIQNKGLEAQVLRLEKELKAARYNGGRLKKNNVNGTEDKRGVDSGNNKTP